MTLIHELLAAENERQNHARNMAKTVIQYFQQGRAFVGQRISNAPLDAPDEEDAEQIVLQPDTYTPLKMRVQDALNAVWEEYDHYLDLLYRKEHANTVARATVRVGDKTLLEDVPVGALLMLEGRLADLRKLYAEIVVLDPAKDWRESDVQQFESQEVKRITMKVQRPLVMYPATDAHPAQTQLITEDKQVGLKTTTFYSGAVRQSQKDEWIHRIDQLLAAVKEARSRANTQEVGKQEVAEQLFDFIHDA